MFMRDRELFVYYLHEEYGIYDRQIFQNYVVGYRNLLLCDVIAEVVSEITSEVILGRGGFRKPPQITSEVILGRGGFGRYRLSA